MKIVSDRLINIFGALALGVTDRIRSEISERPTLGGEGTAALVVIGHNPGLSIDQLGRVLRLSHPGTVRLVDRLIDGGLAERRAAQDRRAVALYLTTLGVTERNALLQRRQKALAEMLDGVAAEDLAVLERLAVKMLESIPADAISALTVCRFCNEQSCVDCPMNVFGKVR